MINEADSFFMEQALNAARKAQALGEIPVGAVLVHNNQILTQAFNQKESAQNPLQHAEIIVLQNAFKLLKNWRLTDCTLFVTLEPCPMCLGALLAARVSRLVFGAFDPKRAEGDYFQSLSQCVHGPSQTGTLKGNNHTLFIQGGVFEDSSKTLLKDFFKAKRKLSSKEKL